MSTVVIAHAELDDLHIFKWMWQQYLEDLYEQGGDLRPTRSALDHFNTLFLAYLREELDGVVLFAWDDHAGPVGCLMWGETSKESPLETRYGRIASGHGTWVRASFRGEHISAKLREMAEKRLVELGFDGVAGLAHVSNTAGIESWWKRGAETIGTVGLIKF